MTDFSLTDVPDLPAELRELLAQIPPGSVTTYGDLADALGNRIAARWVGHYLLHHDHTDDCPCHRVVRADGTLGAYIDGTSTAKKHRIHAEGVATRSARVDLAAHRFTDFQSVRPLARLRGLQHEVATRARIAPLDPAPRTVAAVDVSYRDPDHAVAAYVLAAADTADTLWTCIVPLAVRFPYVSSYLSFRELPAYLALVDAARAADRLADVLLVDGSGILHPRSAGIATHLGVVADLPTIGVTKHHLAGQFDNHLLADTGSAPIHHDGQLRGLALRTTPRARKPIYVSPGHRTDVPAAAAVARALLRGHRLPEPLYLADRLSRAAAKDTPS